MFSPQTIDQIRSGDPEARKLFLQAALDAIHKDIDLNVSEQRKAAQETGEPVDEALISLYRTTFPVPALLYAMLLTEKERFEAVDVFALVDSIPQFCVQRECKPKSLDPDDLHLAQLKVSLMMQTVGDLLALASTLGYMLGRYVEGARLPAFDDVELGFLDKTPIKKEGAPKAEHLAA